MASKKITKDFVGLPIEKLIAGPMIASAHAQAELCKIYLEYIFELAFGEEDPGDSTKTQTVTFNLERPVTNSTTGDVSTETVKIEAPVISLVPVPAFLMQKTQVNFSMEVKKQTAEKDTEDKTGKLKIGGSFFGFGANISGTISTTRENTRSTDKSAKYDISALAGQQPPSEGMAKLTQLFASSMEPIKTSTDG
ncbi:DUF2589 domain-containing protein [Candidatus Leptofilum sp.]|uniref:DUF2589 domain-containing protein n=1 Tax=Candidatus Leptofilum sp. TaxID=3241576 RepID=UPI003B5C348F